MCCTARCSTVAFETGKAKVNPDNDAVPRAEMPLASFAACNQAKVRNIKVRQVQYDNA